jgi:putative ABC transport system permease protein
MVNWLQSKILRDIGEAKKSFIAIICISTLGIALFSGVNLYVSTVSTEVEETYKELNLADYWIYKTEVSSSDMEALKTLSYIESVERRKTFDANMDKNRNASIRIHGIDNEIFINIPGLLSGNLLNRNDSTALLLDSRFATAYNLSAGNVITLNSSGVSAHWRIKGIVKNAEYLYYAPEGLTIPDYERYGFAFINASSIPDIPFNELVVKIKEESAISQEQVVKDVRNLIGNVNIINRMHQPSYRKISDTMDGIKQIGLLFSIAFFLVVGFVTWITIDRMMEKQRQNLGTLRALGYSKKEITARYSVFGFIITAPSLILSWLISRYGIANMLYELGTTYYTIEKTGVYYFSHHIFGATICVLLIICGAVFFNCGKTLKSTTASLLRPKPPKQGKRILLEKIGFFWNHLSFSGKIISRNLFRNKARFSMGFFGIIGSTSLIVCGFGLMNSISRMLDNAFEKTIQYDLEIKFRKPLPPSEVRDIYDKLNNAENIDASMAFGIYLYGKNSNMANPYLVVMDKNQKSLNFKDSENNTIKLPDKGVLITNRLSQRLSAIVGDTLKAERLDGSIIPLKMASVIDFPVGNEIYMSYDAFSDVLSVPFHVRTMLVRGENVDYSDLQNDSRISLVESKAKIKENMMFILNSLQSFQNVLILFSALLSFAVMMVLGQMNFSERIRELATLKVLGFYQHEMKKLVLRENLWVTIFGLPFGVALGYGLLTLILKQATTPELEIAPHISFVSIAVACCLVLIFVLVINHQTGRKFKNIDMVSSLKSVE